ncbi:MAG: hypothetical protein HY422_00960 [Candidatus Komeilibacteria bacterium]|nr:hypothetical protein [Candidatus Komeilibacteria bacterium]
MVAFLAERLKLDLHERKITIRPAWQGVDFLGFVVFPHHTVIRSRTRKRMLRRLTASEQLYENGAITTKLYLASLQSYRGILTHCRARRLLRYIDATFGCDAVTLSNSVDQAVEYGTVQKEFQ